MFPEGGTFNGSSSHTGNIVIKLPDTGGVGVNNMMTCLVRIYDYASNESFDVRFNGYFYGSSYIWTRQAVWIDSSAVIDRNFTVRFGKELGSSGAQDRAVVTIGEANSTWSYPKIAVIQYTPGHSEGTQPQIWNSGWNVSIVTDYWDGTDNTLDDTVNNNQVNNWRRNGQDLYYGSGTGNVGIGVTSPSQKLHVAGNLRVTGAYYDSNNSAGTSGQVLSSTASGTDWVDVLTGSGTSGVLPKWNSAGTALIDSGLSFPIGSSYADFVLGAGGTTTVRFIGNASQTGDFSIKNTTGDIRLQANNTTATTAKFTSSDITLGENTFVQGSLRVEGSVQADLYIGNIFGPSDTNTGYRINHSSLGCFIDVRNDVDKITYRDYPNATGTINSKFEMNMSSGNFTATGNIIAFGTISDRKLKENIKPIDSALDKAMRLQGVTFNWKKSDSILEIGEDIGFIAQDVQKVLPELVRENKNGEFSLRHQGITPILLEAIKELKAEIEELKKQIK
jgi:hypothetical protein